jgi:flagellar assembly protein FliH
LSKIFKSHNVILDGSKLAVDNAMPDIRVSPYELEFGEATVEEALSEQEEIIRRGREEAEKVVREAERKAEQIIAQARVESAKLKEAAEEKARTKGYAEGFEEGQREGGRIKAEAEELLARAKAEREEMIQSAEPDVVELVIKLVRQIAGDALKLKPEAVAALIRAGLAEANTAGGVTVRICPADSDNLIALKKQLAGAVDTGAKLTIVKDPALSRHDVIIETAFGAVDCSLEEQLEAVTDNLYVIMNAGV